MIRPGWTPGPLHSPPSTTVAASQAARSAALFAVARRDGLGEEHALLQARVGRSQEGPGVGPDRAARARTRSRPGPTGARGPRASSAGPSRGPGTRRWWARSAGTRGPGARPRPRSARGPSRGLPNPVMPRYSGWSLGMTSPRRQLAMTGTCRSSAKRTRSFEHRARRTPAPGEDDRPLRRGEEVEHGPQVCRGRRLGVRPDDRAHACPPGSARSWTSSGMRDQRRPGAALHRGPHRGLEGRGGGLRIVDLARPLGEAADRVDEVDLLERLASAEAAVHAAHDDEHRRGVGGGRVDADGEVRRPDGAGPEARGRPARQLAVGLGGERGGTLVAGRDDPDPGRRQGVEDRRGSSRRPR